MRVIGKDRTGCDACNPLDEIIARIEQLERRVVTIVARVQGIPPDGTGNVTLPTSDSVDNPLYGNVGVFAMSSEVKEAAEDVHQYASAIADDVVVLQSDVEILTREIEALDPASVTALQQSVAALQQSVNQLSNTVAGYSAVIGDLEDQMPNKVDRTGDTMTGPLNVIDTATGSRNAQAVNGNRLQNDLDAYAPMIRDTGNQTKQGVLTMEDKINGYANMSLVEYGGSISADQLQLIAKFEKNSVRSYFRGSALFLITGRGGTRRGMLFVRLSIHLGGVDAIELIPMNAVDKATFIVSDDGTYIYVYRTGLSGLTPNQINAIFVMSSGNYPMPLFSQQPTIVDMIEGQEVVREVVP